MAVLSLRAARRRRKLRRDMLLLGGALWYLVIRRNHRSTRSVWTCPWLLKRPDLGAYDTLLSELRSEDQDSFLNFLHVSPKIYDDILRMVTPIIQRQDTNYRQSISPGLRLAITLRYLATGKTFKSLGFLFRTGNNTIGGFIPETCMAVYNVLKDKYFKCPQSEDEWLDVAAGFWKDWNYPNCLGALDGKHIMIRQPACSGAKFFNYKHSFSIILLALVDSSYKFLFCDVGSQGRCSDAGVFAESDLNEAIERNTVNIPPATPLPGTENGRPVAFHIVADDAFPLRRTIMKPFPHRNLEPQQRIFNYRLCRGRRCVENAFGILDNRFRVLLNPICLAPGKVDAIVLACCVLHNMLRTISPSNYIARVEATKPARGLVRPETVQTLAPARVSGRRSATKEAKEQRQYLCDYFTYEGSVSWQDAMV